MLACLPAESLRTAMYDLQRQIDQLARAADPAEAAAVRERIVALLDRCERELSVLLDQTTQPASTARCRGAVAPAADARRKRICASRPVALAPAAEHFGGRRRRSAPRALLRRGQRTAPLAATGHTTSTCSPRMP